MMLTAINANDATTLDVTLLDTQHIDMLNGKRVAKRHGYDLICKGCQRTAHLVKNHRGTVFFRHDPGSGSCILNELTRNSGESEAHLNAKATLITAIRDLTGWHAEPEQRHDLNGDTVIIDVAAHYDGPHDHGAQGDYAWEVQLSPQTAGEFTQRSDLIRRVTSHRVTWLTPHAHHVGQHAAIICDPKAELVAGRLLTSFDPWIDSPTMPVDRIVKSVHRRRPGHLHLEMLDQLGIERSYHVVDINAFRNGSPQRTGGERRTSRDGNDTPCARQPTATRRNAPKADGICICGNPAWTLNNGEPMHPCCADNGPNCEPCRISRDAAKRRRKMGV